MNTESGAPGPAPTETHFGQPVRIGQAVPIALRVTFTTALTLGIKGGTIAAMTRDLRRFHASGQSHFVTFSCYHRLPRLRNACLCEGLLNALEKER